MLHLVRVLTTPCTKLYQSAWRHIHSPSTPGRASACIFPGKGGRSVKQPYVHHFLHLLRGLVNILLTSNSNLHLVYTLLTSIYKRVINLRAVGHTRPLLFTHHFYAGGSGRYLPTTSPLRLYLLQDGRVLTTCCWILS